GDTIFKNSIGRTDLEYGDSKKMKETIIKILDYFKKDYTIYPGHGDITTLNYEKRNLYRFLDLL
ncbi:MAG: MBL fold metallo-hydrolase, partial [Caldisericia bacterium]|nr:MBL fold metallo-hydrolase [Caldisericia bacterium]